MQDKIRQVKGLRCDAAAIFKKGLASYLTVLFILLL